MYWQYGNFDDVLNLILVGVRDGSVYLYVAIAQGDFGEVVHEARDYLRIEAVRFERRLCSFQRNLNFFSHISYQRGKSVSLW